MFWRAARLRCPACGHRPVFRTATQLHDRCPGCRLSFGRDEDGYWVGAMIVNLAVAEGLFFVVFVGALALTYPDVPWTPLLVVSVLLMLGLPIAFYRRSKTLWVALDLRLHPYSDQERRQMFDAGRE